MYRLFIALDLPNQIKRDIESLRFSLPGANWVEPDQHHLTLRFIGEVNGGEFRDIEEALGQLAFPPFSLALKGVGAFHSKREARVLWAGVEKSEALMALQRKLENLLVQTGLPSEQRKYSPHITLARLKNTPFSKIGLFLEYFCLFQTPPFLVEEFHLYSSTRTSKGSYYQQECTYPLNRPRTNA